MNYYVIMCRYADAPTAVWWSAGREAYHSRVDALAVARSLAERSGGKVEYSVWEALPPEGLTA